MHLKQVFSTNSGQEEDKLGQFKYCPFCAAQLSLKEIGGKERPACPNCGFVQFRNPAPGVVVVIEKDGQVLLGKRAGSFGKGTWGLPQGYIEFDEDFLSAAVREVKEETALDVEIRGILNISTNFLSPQLHTLAIILLAAIKAGEPCAGDDLETLEWFPFTGPLPEMAFAADEQIIESCQKMNPRQMLPVDPDFA